MLVRERREELGMSLKDLANDLGVSSAALSKWERGVQPLPEGRYEAIAKALQLDVGALAGGTRLAKEADLNAWRDLVWDDQSLHANTMLVLLWISRKTRTVDGLAAYLGDVEGASKLVRNLTAEQVAQAWPDAMRSPYVQQDADGVVFFTFPAEH